MTARAFLGGWLLLFVTATFGSAAPAKPNIVLIVADDLGAMDLGCYGSKFHRTPHLDQLAAEGVRFTQAYAACPVCSPTRAAIMTGKYPARLNLTDWLPGRPDQPAQELNRPVIRQELPLEEITIAELLRDGGYVTGHIGKWHLGGEGFGPLEQGFQTNIAGDHTGTPLSYFAPFKKNGRVMRGLDNAPEGQYLTERLGIEAAKFIETHREKPFFLYLPHYAVHTPLQAPEAMVAKYPAATPFAGRQNNPIYAAMLESLDSAVGKVRQKLQELNLLDNTIIIFTSDNGGLATQEGAKTPATSNTPLREGKGWLYEGGIRVPLMISGPLGIKPGSTEDTPVCSIDLLPTLCSWGGVVPPAGIDGVSLAPLIQKGEALAPRPLYWHYPHYANQNSRPGGVVRYGQYKLIEYYEHGKLELYDLKSDQSENRNLRDELPDVVQSLHKRLRDWRTFSNAQMPTPNPQYEPNPPNKDGVIEIWSKTARVHGLQLRYEPLPHKNTLGFWVRQQDWAEFAFTVKKPGKYRVEALIGCGNGSGGSEVQFTVGDQMLKYTVKETGGFQAFQLVDLGVVTLSEAKRYPITIKPQSKPGPAVMDLRKITLTPINE
jgi:arylsulfatase A